MSAKKINEAESAYRLGCAAGVLLIEQPEGWRRRLKLNIRRAQKLGVQIDPKTFNDVAGAKS